MFNATEDNREVSLDQLLQSGDTSDRPYTVLTGHNMGNNTLLLSVPMHDFRDISEVANERNIADQAAFANQSIAQRKLDPAHAAKLAGYILKGLFYSVEVKHKLAKQPLPPKFEEMQRALGKQPYLALQPLTANIRECEPGGADLRVKQSGDGQITVYLAQKHVLWVVDGQHRRHAMQLAFDFLKAVLATHKYSKGSLYPLGERGSDVSSDELRVWALIYEAARSRCRVMVEVHLGLTAEQERQLFHDLNNLTKKIESSLAFQFDNSNPVNLFIKEDLIDSQMIEVAEKDKLDWQDHDGSISRKDLIAVNAILFLNKTNISGAKPKLVEEEKPIAQQLWGQIVEITGFGEEGAKQKTVAAQPVVLKALAKLTYDFAFGRNSDPALLEKLIDGISKVDFSHENLMWQYYQLPVEDRDLRCPGLKQYLPSDDSGANRDIGAFDSRDRVMRFGAKHNDIYPILGDMIRWSLNLPSRHKA